MSRLVLSTLIVLLTTAAAPSPREDAVVDRVSRAVVRHHLYPKPNCLDFTYQAEAVAHFDEVEVSERHDATCGGDPGVELRLFEVLVNRDTGAMYQDSTDPVDADETTLDGFRPLR